MPRALLSFRATPLFLSFIIVVATAGCAASNGGAEGDAGTAAPDAGRGRGGRVKVLTWSIDRGRGSDGRLDLERIARVVARSGADLVALQEIDWRTARSGGADQPEAIAKAIGFEHAYAEAMPVEGGSQGEAAFCRRPFGEARRIPLAAPPDQRPTVAVEVTVAPWGDRGERIRFISARLSPESASTRLHQVATLKSSLEGHPSPAILAGNLHSLPGSGPYRLLAEGWVDAARSFGDEAAPTYPAKDPEHRADFVFLRPAERWRVVSVQVLDEPIASSHRPLLVELELLPAVESE